MNIRSVNAGMSSGNEVNHMRKIITHLNLPVSVTPCSYNKILNNIVQSSIEIAGESISKTSRNLICMFRKDDDNNEIYHGSYKSDVKKLCSCCSSNN